jgi:ankyrin repeat protein
VVWAGECDALFFTEGGLTPLHLAAVEDSVAVAALLVRWGADIDARAESGAIPLHWAAVSGSNRVAELLIERGADVNARDKMGRTPLHYASNVDVAWSLIRRGADVNARDKDGIAPLHLAVRGGREDVVSILLKHGADVNAVTAKKVTPLHVAAYYGKAEIAEMLIKHGADVNARSVTGYTPLHYTVLYHGPLFPDDIHSCYYDEEAMCKCINVLIKYGANVDAKDDSGRTPLHYAVEEGYSAVARFLLENGAEVNAVGKFGRTPLHLASAAGYADFVKLLIKYDATVNVLDTFGYTPLHYAAAAGNLFTLAEIIAEELFEEYMGGRTLNICAFGHTSSHDEDYTDIVEMLLIHGANVNAKNNKGVTPLHIAVLLGAVKIVKMLIRYGAYVNARDDEGNTPLHYATYIAHWRALVNLPDKVKLLLENCADSTLRNSRGISALDLAEQLAVNPPKYKIIDTDGKIIDTAEIAKIIFIMMRSRCGTISGGKGSDSVAVVCPYCGKPAYRLGTLGKHYCFNCKRYV